MAFGLWLLAAPPQSVIADLIRNLLQTRKAAKSQ